MYFGACKAVQTGSKLKGFTNLMFNLKYKEISDMLLCSLRAAFLLLSLKYSTCYLSPHSLLSNSSTDDIFINDLHGRTESLLIKFRDGTNLGDAEDTRGWG